MTLETLEQLVISWATDRGIFAASDPKTQMLKTMEEIGELSKHVARGLDVRDDIGDVMVTLILQARMQNTTLSECLQIAYDEISDRKGQMINGTFVKESDLP